MCKMDTLSSIVFYNVLLLCYNSAESVNTGLRNQHLSNKSQNVNETLSTAERVRRLIPYVTYYVVGDNDNNDVKYHNHNHNPNPNTPRLQPNNFYFQNERQPQQKQPIHHEHNYQIPNQSPQQKQPMHHEHNYQILNHPPQKKPPTYYEHNYQISNQSPQKRPPTYYEHNYQISNQSPQKTPTHYEHNQQLSIQSPQKAPIHYEQNQQLSIQSPQKAPIHYEHNQQLSNQPLEQYTTPVYLRFPSSPKVRRPIMVPTTEIPYTIQTEKAYDYYYDYMQTSPRPIVYENPVKYDHGFLPTVPTVPTIPPTPYSNPEPETLSPKAKKLRRPKPKRPTTPITTTTTDKYGALNELLNGYDLGNRLSNKITPENIGSSIETLSAVLQILQNEADEQVRPKKPKPQYRPDPIDEYDTGDEGNQGRPGEDYPIHSTIPKTSFDCKTQRYKGFFGDPDTHCQVWHYCDLNGGQASFLCPNGTIFNQVSLTCDWWFNVKCDTTAQLYVLNERLYKYIIPSKPSFPEDYEGPLVDKYLEDKFKETEQKKSQQREPMAHTMNITTVEPDLVRTPYQQLLDVDA